MAPKAPKKGSEPPAAPPNPDEELGLAAPFTDEAAAAYTAAAGALYEDTKGTELPAELAAVVASWKRPSEFLSHLIGQDGAQGAGSPYIVGASAAPALDGSRALPHPVFPGVPADEGAASVTWMTSALQLIAYNAPKLASGCYLWELIYPKGSDGLPAVSPTGRYGVRLFDHSRWRLVEVDDRMPFDGQDRPLLPLSSDPLELWPLILARAVYKLSAAAPPPGAGAGRDQAALLRLTGWMTETIPILPSVPKATACNLVSSLLSRYGSAIVAVSLPPTGDAAADSLLSERGLDRTALLTVCEVRQVDDTVGSHTASDAHGAGGAHDVNGSHADNGNTGGHVSHNNTGGHAFHDNTGGHASHGNTGARRFVRLQSELMTWRGPFCDMDEMAWSSALASELGWKRMQRLRRVAAGEKLHDFWMDEDSFISLFGSIHVLHAPSSHTAVRTGALSASQAEPSLLMVKAGDDTPAGSRLLTSICVQVARGERPVSLGLSPYRWTDGIEPVPLVALPCADVSAFQIELVAGVAYRVDMCVAAEVGEESLEELESALPPSLVREGDEEEEQGEDGGGDKRQGEEGDAPVAQGGTGPVAQDGSPPVPARPGFYSVWVGSDSPVRIGDVDTVAKEELSLHVHTVGGRTRPVTAGAWGAVLALRIRPSAAGSVRASVRLPADGLPLACYRLHVIDGETGACTSFAGLSTGGLAFAEGSQGSTLIVDVKAPPGQAVAEVDWAATVLADTEVQVSAVPLEEVSAIEQPYVPNPGFRLFRSCVSCAGDVAVHVACPGAPGAALTLRQLQVDREPEAAGDDRQTSVLRSISGVGCVTLLGLEPPAEGSSAEALIECVIDAPCAISTLHLPTRPVAAQAAPPGEGGQAAEGEAGLVWTMRVVGPAGLTVKEDDSYDKSLAALAASWEAAHAGRAAKAKAAREAYLAQVADKGAAADEDGDEKNGEGEGGAAAGGKDRGGTAEAGGGEAAAVEVSGAVVTVRVGAGAEARLLSAEEREADSRRLQMDVERARAQLAASEARRLTMIESAAAAGATQLEAARAARSATAQAATAAKTKCAQLVAAMLPPPLAPAEPEPGKGKKGKK